MKRDINVVFEGSMPNNYDRYLGPFCSNRLWMIWLRD
jgi:hypothetical protein